MNACSRCNLHTELQDGIISLIVLFMTLVILASVLSNQTTIRY